MGGQPKRRIISLLNIARAMRESATPDTINASIFEAQAEWIKEREIAKSTGRTMCNWDRKNVSPFIQAGIADYDGEIIKQTHRYHEKIEEIMAGASKGYARKLVIDAEASEYASRGLVPVKRPRGRPKKDAPPLQGIPIDEYLKDKELNAVSLGFVDIGLGVGSVKGVNSGGLLINDAWTGVRDHSSKRVFNNSKLGQRIEVDAGTKNMLAKIKLVKVDIKRRADESIGDDELKVLARLMKKAVTEERRFMFRHDFYAFDNYLFQDLQDRVATAEFHFDMFRLYELSRRACVVCPRGHAKTTTARKYVLHQILNRKETYIVIVGASESMAAQTLRWIRDQFTENDRLLDVYGYLANKNKWADTEFEVEFRDENNKVYHSCKVVARGANQKIRGVNEKGRPTLYYIDDIEDDEQVESMERREKLAQWVTDAMMPSGSKNARFIITGTILNMDSLLMNIALNKIGDHIQWDVLFYAAIYKDSLGVEKALWQEHQPLDKLEKLRERNPISFSKEYQNNPAAGKAAVFNSDAFKHLNDEYISVKDDEVYYKNELLRVMIHTDYAYTDKQSSDFTVYLASGMNKDGRLYVLDYLMFKTADEDVMIDELFDFCKQWRTNIVTMEDQIFQHVLSKIIQQQMNKRGYILYIKEMRRGAGSKLLRIKSLGAPIRLGQIYWSYRHNELEGQLLEVTSSSLGRWDDIIDTLADAWRSQIEAREEDVESGPEINTYEWLIAQGVWAEDEERIENARR